ncbi:HD domain-containing protein [Alkalicoccus luteus]|uniref:HD domain-containing protein n=1 Tax=Alkalicoccus luteus TaxID=1237094 RepID=A0A969PN24_9BACI|nr:HD domain-containing protein [Alkalicoccus luteus]NJP37235.1 HD domain-containing protein [Alkalicoccus luteus]
MEDHYELINEAWKTAELYFSGDSSGHDIDHSRRVHKLALHLCHAEGGKSSITELIAILHDIGDHKLDSDKGTELIRQLGYRFPAKAGILHEVLEECARISFSKGGIPLTLEGKIVQDADRLDSIGAIGVARCFMFAGNRGHRLTDDRRSAVQHFYDKLLKIKDTLHTDRARQEAERRHAFLNLFLNELEQDLDPPAENNLS